ncbi:MAG: DNA gyrase inhibitor YacG [Halobacteriovoraceae bacterium]|nr:DNA gyrase inhibitor YacG [Halobacteriovoraceae bacterium]|tara:strand:- start:6971 stop:7189 length:219 start_codon:yes stop_codon:yes gene_type:complete
MKNELKVKCPQCKKEFSYYQSEFRPFCGHQCKMIDLGGWLSEDYKVAGRDQSVYIEDEEALHKLLVDSNETY